MYGSKSKKLNKAWLHEHLNDPYVKLAQKHQYRSRAAFKLIGIDEQDRLIRPGITVVDLGSAPGSWSQVVRRRLARASLPADIVRADDARSEAREAPIAGRVLALDLLPMAPIAGVEFLDGDFREATVVVALEAALAGGRADLVLSDMAPNLSGVDSADAARMQDLAELALAFADAHLTPDGALLIKAFHGSGYGQLVRFFKNRFVSVATRKPKASRDRSAETYLLGRRLKQSV